MKCVPQRNWTPKVKTLEKFNHGDKAASEHGGVLRTGLKSSFIAECWWKKASLRQEKPVELMADHDSRYL
jgi:hypothetical protein